MAVQTPLTQEQFARRKQSAMAKAVALLMTRVGAESAANGSQRSFGVIGSQGNIYDIVATDEEVTCPCKAGEFGCPCYHVSLVELRMALDRFCYKGDGS